MASESAKELKQFQPEDARRKVDLVDASESKRTALWENREEGPWIGVTER